MLCVKLLPKKASQIKFLLIKIPMLRVKFVPKKVPLIVIFTLKGLPCYALNFYPKKANN